MWIIKLFQMINRPQLPFLAGSTSDDGDDVVVIFFLFVVLWCLPEALSLPLSISLCVCRTDAIVSKWEQLLTTEEIWWCLGKQKLSNQMMLSLCISSGQRFTYPINKLEPQTVIALNLNGCLGIIRVSIVWNCANYMNRRSTHTNSVNRTEQEPLLTSSHVNSRPVLHSQRTFTNKFVRHAHSTTQRLHFSQSIIVKSALHYPHRKMIKAL